MFIKVMGSKSLLREVALLTCDQGEQVEKARGKRVYQGTGRVW